MRNPPWTRDELILALDLYLRRRDNLPGHGSPEVVELSGFLNQMGSALGRSVADTYRNVNGVYMKLMNYRRIDPLYLETGKIGLARGNKDEAVVWDLFASDPLHLSTVCQAIRNAAAFMSLPDVDEPEIHDAPEGRILTRMHRYRERDKGLVQKAKKAALKRYGRLACEACGFDFKEAYGARGDGLIDVHHTRPLHTVTENHRTNVEDLALLCANCHRIVHAKREWLTVQEVRGLMHPHA